MSNRSAGAGKQAASPQVRRTARGKRARAGVVALGEQLDAFELLGPKAEAQELEQVVAAAAADLEQRARVELGHAGADQHADDRPLPFLHRRQRRRVREAVAQVAARAPRIPRAHGFGFGFGRSLVAHRDNVAKPARGRRAMKASHAPAMDPRP